MGLAWISEKKSKHLQLHLLVSKEFPEIMTVEHFLASFESLESARYTNFQCFQMWVVHMNFLALNQVVLL